ncbi:MULTISPECIES: hypothetical protein [Acinetobacter calcoaceticus/baumannii complex]|nr:hypothetical protein [Acinetobacter lactucae]MDD9317826.1 hypothetical protein [Acinetobacter lactucae]
MADRAGQLHAGRSLSTVFSPLFGLPPFREKNGGRFAKTYSEYSS